MNKNFPVLLQSCRPGTGGLVQISNIDFAYIKHDYTLEVYRSDVCFVSHGPRTNKVHDDCSQCQWKPNDNACRVIIHNMAALFGFFYGNYINFQWQQA